MEALPTKVVNIVALRLLIKRLLLETLLTLSTSTLVNAQEASNEWEIQADVETDVFYHRLLKRNYPSLIIELRSNEIDPPVEVELDCDLWGYAFPVGTPITQVMPGVPMDNSLHRFC